MEGEPSSAVPCRTASLKQKHRMEHLRHVKATWILKVKSTHGVPHGVPPLTWGLPRHVVEVLRSQEGIPWIEAISALASAMA